MDASELKARVRLEEVIAATGTELQGRGRYLRGVEHDSLVVDTHAQMWNWNSQGLSGDVFTWLETVKHLSFTEACAALERGDYGRACLPAVAAKPIIAPTLAQDLHLRYHRNLDPQAREWWHAQGINDEGIARFFLGVCDYHDLWRQTTYTIPILEGGRLVNVRHRLAQPPQPKDKYRPECAGLGVALFNSDVLTPELGGAVIVAGEKKVIVLWQYGIPAISSTAGCATWRAEWTTRLQFCRKVFVAFDPGESAAAWKIAEAIGERAFVVNLPDKPDDFIHAHGPDAFRALLRESRTLAQVQAWQAALEKARETVRV